jgi:hypothetical protein
MKSHFKNTRTLKMNGDTATPANASKPSHAQLLVALFSEVLAASTAQKLNSPILLKIATKFQTAYL